MRYMVYLIELKITVIKMFIELGRKVYENSENFQKMIENIRKYQTEVRTEKYTRGVQEQNGFKTETPIWKTKQWKTSRQSGDMKK